MRNRITSCTNRLLGIALLAASLVIVMGASGCGSSAPPKPPDAPKRYPLSGRVVSVEKDKQQVVVDAKEIPGFMMAMTMGYSVKSPDALNKLSPEDQIKADVVVNDKDVYLENIEVLQKEDATKAPVPDKTNSTTASPQKK